jgi:hypothetical protein
MVVSATPIQSLEDLRAYVRTMLCLHNDLEPDAHPMTENRLQRQGAFCGITFCVHGPRATKLLAIWEIDSNSILFFNAAGERTFRKMLAAKPSLAN